MEQGNLPQRFLISTNAAPLESLTLKASSQYVNPTDDSP